MAFLDESKKIFLESRDVILERFPSLESTAAFGAAGSGSEFFGFDDDISRDHDYAPGFCIFLTDDDDLRYGVGLSRLYRELVPSGVERKSAMSSSRLGVIRTSDFYQSHIGSPCAPDSWQQWMYTPSNAFAEATNGLVFEDSLWEFSSIRNTILHGMPEDVRLKKIAARCALAAQSGQYNYSRCLSHGEKGAASLALGEFVRNISEMVFLLDGVHAPYYKWIFRSMRNLPNLSFFAGELEDLFASGESGRAEMIEKISSEIIDELKRRNLTSSSSDYLEDHAISVQSRIASNEIRSLHLMEG